MSRARVEEREGKKKKSLAKDFLIGFFLQFRDEILLVVVGAVAAIVRAMGVTVESGQTGLLFSFGRAKRTLDPGFHLLVPFLQRARKVPTRSRTLDLPAQRVVTFSGLVYHVDANLVWRITDVRKALIEIDDVEKGMRQMLGLGVQEVVRASDREHLMQPERLDAALKQTLSQRLAAWGVEVERAGLTSITPSKQTLRITQIGRVTGERRTMATHLAEHLGDQRALALIGTRVRPIRRHLHLRTFERRARRVRRLRQALMRHGWMAVQIQQAALRLRARSTTGGRLKTENKSKIAGAAKVGERQAAGTTPRRGQPRNARKRVPSPGRVPS